MSPTHSVGCGSGGFCLPLYTVCTHAPISGVPTKSRWCFQLALPSAFSYPRSRDASKKAANNWEHDGQPFSEDILFQLEATRTEGFLFKGRDCVTGGRWWGETRLLLSSSPQHFFFWVFLGIDLVKTQYVSGKQESDIRQLKSFSYYGFISLNLWSWAIDYNLFWN